MWSNKPFTTMRSNAATPKPVTAPTSPAITTTCADFSTTRAASVSTFAHGVSHPAAHA